MSYEEIRDAYILAQANGRYQEAAELAELLDEMDAASDSN